MGQRVLIDTNVILDYTSGSFDVKGSVFLENVFDTDFNISIIVKIEALGYNEEPDKMHYWKNL